MRKHILNAVSLVLITGLVWFIALADDRNIQDNFQLNYTVADTSGNPVSGETITLQILKVSNDNWYDFADNAFKAAPTTISSQLSEDGSGNFYYYLFNPPASESGPEQYIFVVDNASATYGDHQTESVTYSQTDKLIKIHR